MKATTLEDSGIKTILPMLKKIPHCEGIIFSGSRLTGTQTKNSDYDFTVLISKGKSYYKIWEYKGYMVDICCVTYDKAKEKDLVKTRTSNAELFILATGLIVFDKYGNMKKIQDESKKIWKSGPAKISKNDITEIGYAFKTYIDDLKSSVEKNIDCYYYQNYVIYNVVKFFFKLYREWQTRPRDIEQEIQRIDVRFWKLFKDANSSMDKDRTIKIIVMIKYLVKKFNLPQTGYIYFEKK